MVRSVRARSIALARPAPAVQTTIPMKLGAFSRVRLSTVPTAPRHVGPVEFTTRIRRRVFRISFSVKRNVANAGRPLLYSRNVDGFKSKRENTFRLFQSRPITIQTIRRSDGFRGKHRCSRHALTPATPRRCHEPKNYIAGRPRAALNTTTVIASTG